MSGRWASELVGTLIEMSMGMKDGWVDGCGTIGPR